MKQTNVITLNKDWWKEEREGSRSLIIAKPPRRQFQENKNYTVKQAAALLGVSIYFIYECIKDGLEVQPLNRDYRILGAAMNDYLFILWKRNKEKVG